MTQHDERPGITLLTGAAGRIGSAIARELARRGQSLVLTDLDGEALHLALDGLLAEHGARAVLVPADLSVEADVERLFRHALEGLGGIDACVNGAGIEGPVAPTDRLDLGDVRRVFDVNVFGILRVLAQVLPHFKAQGRGRIVNLASGAGLGGVPYLTAYSSSKHAVVGLTRSLALEVAADNISVNAVCPGCVESEMMDRIETSLRELTGEDVSFRDSIPMRRFAGADEIANLVAYLVCDAPTYITGSMFVIDGGLRT